MIRMYQAGWTTVTIGAKFGLSPGAVNSRLRRAGVTIRPPHRGCAPRGGNELAERIVAKYIAGSTARQIAADVGISEQTVRRRLRAANVPERAPRLHPRTVRLPDDAGAIGYLAGLIDGEGHIGVKRRDGRSPGGKLAIYNTCEAVMDWLAANIGGAVRWDNNRVSKGWLPIGIWEVYRANDVAAILTVTLPYLIVKRAVAQDVLRVVAGNSAH